MKRAVCISSSVTASKVCRRVGPLRKTAGLFGRAAFFKRLNRHGVVDRKVADARGNRQMSAAPKPAPDVLKHANVRTLGRHVSVKDVPSKSEAAISRTVTVRGARSTVSP